MTCVKHNLEMDHLCFKPHTQDVMAEEVHADAAQMRSDAHLFESQPVKSSATVQIADTASGDDTAQSAREV